MIDLQALTRYPVDPSQIGSPDWWLVQLEAAMVVKRSHHDRLWRYGTGDSLLMDIAPTVRESYVAFQKRARTNFAGLAVEAMLDLMHECGVRTGAEGDTYGDALAWDMWQANELDANMPALRRACFVMGEAFATVGDVDPEVGAPLVTIEDPRNMAAARDPLRRRKLRATCKIFADEWTGKDHAYVTLRGDLIGPNAPTMVWRAERTSATGMGFGGGSWEWVGDPQRLPFRRMPTVWYPNLLDIDGKTTWGEFEQHTDVIDRINTTTLQRLVIAAMQAFRQRVLKNLPTHDETGAVIDYEGVFTADPAALWMVPEGVEVWESAAVDLSPLLHANRDDVKDFAAVLRTPLPALSPDAANQSSANTELVKSGHVAKCIDRIAAMSESDEEVISLMFLWMGDEVRASRRDMEMLWVPPNLPSMSERYDAAAKATAAGVPRDWVLLNLVGMSPQELSRMVAAEAAQEAAEPPEPVGVASDASDDPEGPEGPDSSAE